ncbi:hypothetical protein E2C01_006551 [Portunus trituberculatus]|uniref:Uncharacterized protein n=1 Tax=Portunus trituberculatus TaxID=210409 RepID=A0A5B7CYG9_PORTR|nr:hypothetical protein [Portunus trituberculatus]
MKCILIFGMKGEKKKVHERMRRQNWPKLLSNRSRTAHRS